MTRADRYKVAEQNRETLRAVVAELRRIAGVAERDGQPWQNESRQTAVAAQAKLVRAVAAEEYQTRAAQAQESEVAYNRQWIPITLRCLRKAVARADHSHSASHHDTLPHTTRAQRAAFTLQHLTADKERVADAAAAVAAAWCEHTAAGGGSRGVLFVHHTTGRRRVALTELEADVLEGSGFVAATTEEGELREVKAQWTVAARAVSRWLRSEVGGSREADLYALPELRADVEVGDAERIQTKIAVAAVRQTLTAKEKAVVARVVSGMVYRERVQSEEYKTLTAGQKALVLKPAALTPAERQTLCRLQYRARGVLFAGDEVIPTRQRGMVITTADRVQVAF